MPSSPVSSSARTPTGRTTAALVPQGQLAGQPDVPLDRPVTSVGSGEQNRLQLASRTISRAHALFVKSGETVYVIDLASRTGVQVNGSPVRDHDLNSGDRVQIGKFVFRYRTPTIGDSDASSASAPAAVVIRPGSPPVRINGRSILIGRRDACDLILPEESGASSVHAVLFEVDHNWVLMDLESRAGTAVNGTSVLQQVIRFGDRLTIGAATVLFQPAVDQPAASSEPAPLPFDAPVPAEAESAAHTPIPVEIEPPEPEPVPVPVDGFGTHGLDPLPFDEPAPAEAEPAEPVPVPFEGFGVHGLEPLPFTESQSGLPEPVVADSVQLEPVQTLDETPVETIEPATAATADLPVELAHVPAEARFAPPAVHAELTDTTFGRMVGDFTADSTGPLVEEPAIASPAGFSTGPNSAEPAAEITKAAVAVEPEHVDPVPEPVPETAPKAPQAAAPEPAAETTEAEQVLEPPSESGAAEAPGPSTHTALIPPAAATAWVPPLLDELDDFVFVPDAEVVASVPEVLFWGDDDLGETPDTPPAVAAEARHDGTGPPAMPRSGGGATAPDIEPPPEPSAPAEYPEQETTSPVMPGTAGQDADTGQAAGSEILPVDGNPQPAVAIAGKASDPPSFVATLSASEELAAAGPVAADEPSPSTVPVETAIEPVESEVADRPAWDSADSPEIVLPVVAAEAGTDAMVDPAAGAAGEAVAEAAGLASADLELASNETVDRAEEAEESVEALPAEPAPRLDAAIPAEPDIHPALTVPPVSLAEDEAIEIGSAAEAFLGATAHFESPPPVRQDADPLAIRAEDFDHVGPVAQDPAPAEPFDVAELQSEPLEEPAPVMSWLDPAPAAEPGDPAAAANGFSDPTAFVDPMGVSPADESASEPSPAESGPSAESATSAELSAAGPFDVADLDPGTETIEEPAPVMSWLDPAPAAEPGDPPAAATGFSDPTAFVDPMGVSPADESAIEPSPAELVPSADSATSAELSAAGPFDIGLPSEDAEDAIVPGSQQTESASGGPAAAEPFDIADLESGVDTLEEPALVMSWVDPAPTAEPGDPSAATTDFSDPAVFVDPELSVDSAVLVEPVVLVDAVDAAPAEAGAASLVLAAAAEAAALVGTIPASAAMESASGAVSIEHAVPEQTPAIEPPAEPAHHLTSTAENTGYQVTINTDGSVVSDTSDDPAGWTAGDVPPASTAAAPDSAALETASGAISVTSADPRSGAVELDWLPVHDHDEPPSGLIEIHDGEFGLVPMASSAGLETAGTLDPVPAAAEPLIFEGTVIDDLAGPAGVDDAGSGWSIGAIHQALLATQDNFEPEWIQPSAARFTGIDDQALVQPGPAEARFGAVDVGPADMGAAAELPGDVEVASEDDFDFFEPVDSTPEIGINPGAGVQTETAVMPGPPQLETAPPATAIEATIATDLPGAGEPPVTSSKPRGPSLFGFQFDGGSFLGGMPLSLNAAPEAVIGAVTGAVVPAVAIGAVVAEAIGAVAAVAIAPPVTPGVDPAVARPAAIAPVAPPVTVPSPTFDAKSRRPTGLSSIAQAIAPQAAPVVIPPLAKRPATPPRPVLSRPSEKPAPVLPGVIGDMPGADPAPMIPPTSPEALANTLGRRPLSTAFAAPNVRPKPADIFSQVTTPIGVEVFGGPVVELGKIGLPDTVENPNVDPVPVQSVAGPAVPQLRHRPIGMKVPILMLLILALPAGLWWVVNRYVPTTATVVGSMSFAGLSQQTPQAQETFKSEQQQLLESDPVRQSAETLLIVEGQEPGFTENPATYAEAIGPTSLGITGDTMQLTVNTPRAEPGRQQVLAVLRAMQTEDKRLGDKRGRALLAADQARAAVENSIKNIESIKAQRWSQLGKAQDGPNQFAVEDQEKAAADARQLYDRAKSSRQANESLLAELRKQDTSATINPEANPDVIELRKEIREYQGQLDAAAKRSAAGNSIRTDDPLLDVIRQELTSAGLKLDSRLETLKAAAAMSPAERDRQRNQEVERLSIAETSFEKAEQTARDASEAATSKAKTARDRLDQAQAAAVLADQLKQQQDAAEHDQLQLAETEKEKEAAAAETIGPGGPVAANVDPASITNPRPVITYAGSSLMVLVLVLMIIGELRQPPAMPGVRPAAGTAPRRVVPWPQPEQIQALDDPVPVEQAAEF